MPANHDAYHPDILAGIDDIPWAELQHAYGSAADVPDKLRALLDQDEEIRNRASASLFSTLWHQHTVYEATAYAVPFLLRMLAWQHTPDRLDVLRLLTAIADGQSYLNVHARLIRNLEERLAEQGTSLEAELAKELGWVDAAKSAVAKGIPLYLELMNDSSKELRKQAIITLAYFPQHSEQSVPQLLAALHRADDEEIATYHLYALSALLDESLQSQQLLTALIERLDGLPSYIAATALASRAGAATPPHVINLIVEQLPSDPDEYQTMRGQIALLWLGTERAQPELLRALLRTTNADNALSLASSLLDLEFCDGNIQYKERAISWNPDGEETIEFWRMKRLPPREPASLTASQRQLLIHLLEHDAFWEQPHNLLTLYGMPSDREALKEYLR